MFRIFLLAWRIRPTHSVTTRLFKARRLAFRVASRAVGGSGRHPVASSIVVNERAEMIEEFVTRGLPDQLRTIEVVSSIKGVDEFG